MSLLTYKGYTAEVEYDPHEGILYGHVLDLRDTITFQSESAAEIADEFHTSVDEYLSFCAEQGIEPAKPYSGTLYIRTSPDVHREAAIAAAQEGKSLNAWLAEVVAQAAHHAVQPSGETTTDG
jgi:predicted HicB family RNase H-like nuclease